LTNLNQGYLLPLDFNAYLKLRRDISKALFGHLSVWFYASRGQIIEKRYPDLCQLLNIRAYPHLSKASSVLAPSLDELVDIEYLSSWELVRTARGADFKLSLSPGKRLLSLPNFSPVVNPEARAAMEARLPVWVSELIERGVTERKARQLALDIADEQPVGDQIEYAEHLIQQDRRGRGKIANPAGFLVWAIENNLAIPANFETARKRQLRRTEQAASHDQHFRMLELRNEYDAYAEQQIASYIAAHYPAERLETALREQMKTIRREQPDWFARVPDATRREVAMARLRSAVRESLPLLSFERWTAARPQPQLF
jgi:hypothetical protein